MNLILKYYRNEKKKYISGNPLPKVYPDLPAESGFRYGAREGIYRMLRLWDKHNIKVTSHVVDEAAINILRWQKP